MMLRRLMGWEMIDLTYSVMMETKKGVLRWDNQELVDVPHFASLPLWVSRACRLVSYVLFLFRFVLVLLGKRAVFVVTGAPCGAGE